MPRGPEDDPELSEIEAALGSLAPAKGRLDRDRLMYEAGRASARAGSAEGRRWKAAASVLALVALGEGAWLAGRAPGRVVERVVVVREAAPSPAPAVDPSPSPIPEPRPTVPPAGFGPNARDRLAWQVARFGLDGLPAPGPSSGLDRPQTRRSLLEEVGKDLDLGDPS